MRRQSQRSLWSLPFLTAVCSLLALLSACEKPKGNFFEGNAATYRPECPVDSVFVQVDSGETHFASFQQLEVAGSTTLVPEYHDCQRFPVGRGGTYGPLVGIFAREHLNDQIDRLLKLAASGATKRAVGIGLILSFDGAYNPLGIRHAFNCLYMWAEISGNDTTRNAFLTPVGHQEDCLTDRDPRRPGANSKTLFVRLQRDLSLGVADYPEVARWDWDPMHHQQYMEIGCLNAWCDIGNASLNGTGSPDRDDPSLPGKGRRVLKVKPWYDEQRLADFGPTGVIFASDVTGTFYPDPGLALLGAADYATHQWKTVAYSFLSAPLATYVTKLNFEAGNVDATTRRVNTVELCQGTRAADQCNIPATETITDCGNAADAWWARITSVSGVVKYRCVIRRTHSGLTIPGLVRWRWAPDDERGWISCPEGCCEVVGEKG